MYRTLLNHIKTGEQVFCTISPLGVYMTTWWRKNNRFYITRDRIIVNETLMAVSIEFVDSDGNKQVMYPEDNVIIHRVV